MGDGHIGISERFDRLERSMGRLHDDLGRMSERDEERRAGVAAQLSELRDQLSNLRTRMQYIHWGLVGGGSIFFAWLIVLTLFYFTGKVHIP